MSSVVYDTHTTVRVDGEDCQGIVEEMKLLNQMAGEGSTIRFELPFNGLGWGLDKAGPGLNQCSEQNRDAFNWISHTFSHQHLDWANDCGEKAVKCIPTTASQIERELQKNIDLIDGKVGCHMFCNDPQGLEYVSCTLSLLLLVPVT